MTMLERVAFLQQLPLLLKGTSDDDTPCPGYLYEEFAKISYESVGSCQCLLEYLLNRLQTSSCHVKLKVLKILLSLCFHGSPQFIQDLRRNSAFIQEAAAVNGPPDPLHGISLYKKVRATAQEVVGNLFADSIPCSSHTVPTKERSQPGMGSQASSAPALQGFGYSQEQKNLAGCHRTGIPGGGWDESDSGNSSQESPHDKSPHSRSSDVGSKSGSDGHSRSSQRESLDITDRVESTQLSDCQQEARLVQEVTQGKRVFLTQEESQQFVRGCSLLNCEVVFEMLNCSLMDDNNCVKLRSMCAVSSLMASDLLSHEHMLAVVRKNLQKLREGPPGPVKNKATKILLQFQALTQNVSERGSSHHGTVASPNTRCPLDVLTDFIPHSVGGGLLTPLSVPSSPTLNVQNTVCSLPNGAENQKDHNGSSEKSDPVEKTRELECEETGNHKSTSIHVSLFEGMELVGPIRCSHNEATGSQELPVELVKEEPSKPTLPSVFSFLNT
ncbi:AP-4 complex accessory subunit tepsin isoform X3 [Xenopus tropicalis]|uniref:AP-4 complex accessory subunit Tepsin n=1 Tax=Xenopus tropicalis TaxID=8364 RepID=A0A8J1IXM8_XENTR|nr:AP-4 complex accessory subunit tepsin isoform X3 [Xenopus tropicalis]